MNVAQPSGRARASWFRRHPLATGLSVLVAGFLALILIFPGEESRGTLGIGVATIALVHALIVRLVTWLIDRARDRRPAPEAFGAMPTAIGFPPPPSGGAPAAQGMPGVWTAEASAFEETAHVHLPQHPTVDPNRYQPVRLGDILEMNPTEFEQLCVRVLVNLGYREVRRTGGAGDLGADVVGKDPQGRSIIVQCKRYAPGNAVGSPTIQTFIGMKAVHHKADRGIVMTTAEFSRPAVQLALEHDIVLIDGDDMVKVLNLMGSR